MFTHMKEGEMRQLLHGAGRIFDWPNIWSLGSIFQSFTMCLVPTGGKQTDSLATQVTLEFRSALKISIEQKAL